MNFGLSDWATKQVAVTKLILDNLMETPCHEMIKSDYVSEMHSFNSISVFDVSTTGTTTEKYINSISFYLEESNFGLTWYGVTTTESLTKT